MRKLPLAAILAITNIVSCIAANTAADTTVAIASKATYLTNETNGEKNLDDPASEPPGDDCLTSVPEEIGPQQRPDRCLPCLSCRPCHCLYGEVEALFLEQVPLYQNRPIVVDANTAATFLSSSDLDSGFEPGVRAMF